MTHPTTADKGELLPCPFCASHASACESYYEYGTKHSIDCDECFGTSGEYGSKEAAIAAWNRRPTNEGQADHTEQHLEMVKADAVKMPDGLTDDACDRIYESELIAQYGAIPDDTTKEDYRFVRALTRRIATAHTAEAVRELVDGLRALDDLRGIFGEPDPAKVKAAWEKCSALLAKYAPSQEGKA